jgi:membrane associated rhomboid family serine protease
LGNNRITVLGRQRYFALTITAAVAAGVGALMFGAPLIPAGIGVVVAVGWLIWRAPAE